MMAASANDQGDSPEAWGDLYATVQIPSGLSNTEVQKAIVAAVASRGWILTARKEHLVAAHLKHGEHEAQVTLPFDVSQAAIYCVGWKINERTGVRERPALPKGWLKNMQEDLAKNFNRILRRH